MDKALSLNRPGRLADKGSVRGAFIAEKMPPG